MELVLNSRAVNAPTQFWRPQLTSSGLRRPAQASAPCFSRPLTRQEKGRVHARLDFQSPIATNVRQVTKHEVKFITPAGLKTVMIPEDTCILDAAEEAGLELPYSCREGTCSSCAGKVEHGMVDQHEQAYLDEENIDRGYALLCVAYPRSELVISTHQEDIMYK